ncbi:TonB-dependent siderophore receptor [Bradyrhizobium sp. CB3481]|uniref:TonB-dependent siderophore receptor n=1 Tax=Bradyrhizobium sp. CB3481 TaxID=3039158 RepID=UPI0024B2200A|nr:TonB-dependent siderophore receptor [Bradyrhizobium sp. CB3481]WFU20557.1 TonB-dependent siderophore receptor [Bradyrhizobium sp. CB3481]
MLRVATLATVSVLALSPQVLFAQSNSSRPSSGAASLPPVVVAAPEARRRVAAPERRQTRRATQAARTSRPQPQRSVGVVVENPRGAVQGYVAGHSMAGTKTNTPIMETPQSLSVIGSEQIRDQKPGKFDEILRYTPGVVAGTFGADTRNDWFLIRGFKSEDVGLFLDGLQLFYTSYASWKLQPFNLERVEVLRGPSAVLYGGSSPSGIVNAVSKTPPVAPIRYLETGVNNFGNAYLGFDFGGPVATAPGNGQLFYRVVGQVQNGGTQVDFTPNNNYFIAPSLTWKPDADTTFTVLASASKLETRSENFLPYIGTVVDAPFGRIPTRLFTSDPHVDSFKREQEMLGYQLERNLSDDVTFRQNARFAHVDVTLSTLFGLGYVGGDPATASLARGNFLTRGVANQGNLDSQLEYRFNTGILRHTALFGLDLKHYRIDDRQEFTIGAPSLNLLNPIYAPTAAFTGAFNPDTTLSQKQLGFYAQDQIKLDRFTLVLSGRNDWVATNNDNHIGASQSREDSKFSGRAGLIYNFDSGLAPYVSYATSYNPVVTLTSALQLALPETGQQTEVGVKFQPNGFNGHFGIALFDLKRQNVLTTDPSSLPPRQMQNGEWTSRGIELEAVANPLPGLKLVGAFTSYDLFVSKDANPALIGKVPTATPQTLTSGWVDYTFQSGPLTGFGLGGGVRYIGGSFADDVNTKPVPSVVLGDATIHYEWQNWRAALNVINVADTVYVANCSSANACFYGDRRRATASLSYKW